VVDPYLESLATAVTTLCKPDTPPTAMAPGEPPV
jgi:hypothetical protein